MWASASGSSATDIFSSAPLVVSGVDACPGSHKAPSAGTGGPCSSLGGPDEASVPAGAVADSGAEERSRPGPCGCVWVDMDLASGPAPSATDSFFASWSSPASGVASNSCLHARVR